MPPSYVPYNKGENLQKDVSYWVPRLVVAANKFPHSKNIYRKINVLSTFQGSKNQKGVVQRINHKK